jgi:hypothetical protein
VGPRGSARTGASVREGGGACLGRRGSSQAEINGIGRSAVGLLQGYGHRYRDGPRTREARTRALDRRMSSV